MFTWSDLHRAAANDGCLTPHRHAGSRQYGLLLSAHLRARWWIRSTSYLSIDHGTATPGGNQAAAGADGDGRHQGDPSALQHARYGWTCPANRRPDRAAQPQSGWCTASTMPDATAARAVRLVCLIDLDYFKRSTTKSAISPATAFAPRGVDALNQKMEDGDWLRGWRRGIPPRCCRCRSPRLGAY